MFDSHSAVRGKIVALVVLAMLGGYGLHRGLTSAAGDDAPPAAPAQEQPEVLTRGPVHESFAEPVDTQAQAGLAAAAEPPANIQETPPDERPDGAVWVPGYWGWDSDGHRYIWVTGCWRVAPPKTYWVPGYWAQTGNNWTWVPGFWAPSSEQELEYLPAPPEVTDFAAPGAPPAPDSVWVPPCPYWVNGQYVSRPGYWLPFHSGWVWVPSHYIWTPRGHCFAPGHWDYEVSRRGLLFAPVAYAPSVHFAADFRFAPTICVDMDGLSVNLFACPRYSHFYFGDYYDDGYVAAGIYPWFECEQRHTWYDADFQYDRSRFRKENPKWEDNIRHDFDTRHADKNLRPPRTYKDMEARVAKAPEAQRRALRVAQPLSGAVASKTTAMKFERVSPEAKTQIVQQTGDVSKFRDERRGWESSKANTPPANHGQPSDAVPPKPGPTLPTPRPNPTPPTPKPTPTPTPPEPKPTPIPAPEPKPLPPQPQPQPTPAPQPRDTTPPANVPSHDAGPARSSDRVKVPSRPYGDDRGGAADKAPPERPGDENKPGAGGNNAPQRDNPPRDNSPRDNPPRDNPKK